MINSILGKKLKQSQTFDEKGKRLPVTFIEAGPCSIVQIKKQDKDKYWAVQLGFLTKLSKNIKKPQIGHFKKAGIKKNLPRFLREIRLEKEPSNLKLGQEIKVEDVLKIGDIVAVTGISKGKGFSGVMKRWNFAGGPRTHGQSDRKRAPGSIGGGTTPGRVYKGKKMAGRMGQGKITVKGLKVLKIDKEKNLLVISGLVAGVKKGLLIIKKKQKNEN